MGGGIAFGSLVVYEAVHYCVDHYRACVLLFPIFLLVKPALGTSGLSLPFSMGLATRRSLLLVLALLRGGVGRVAFQLVLGLASLVP